MVDITGLFGKSNFDPVGSYVQGAKVRREWDQDAALKETFANMPVGADGKPDYMAVAHKLFGAGAVQPGMGIAQLAQAQADKEIARNQWQQTFGLQQQQFSRQNQNDQRSATQQDRMFQLQKAASDRAETKADEGSTEGRAKLAVQYGLKPGTSEHQKYVLTGALPEDKPRNLSVGDIGKLTEEGGKYQSVSGFGQTFRPEFSGYGSQTIGNAAMLAGRMLPNAVLPKGTEEAANWWQGYDRYKNVIRNDLFGSALTATEKAAFDAADINPGMKPDVIAANLAKQKAAIESGVKRKAAAMVQSGYAPDAISTAFGATPEQLGIAGLKKGTAPQAPAQTQPATAAQQPRATSVPGAKQAPDGKFYAPDPSRPGKWLRIDD